MNNNPFGEIITSDLHSWTVQSWQWDKVAPFGSLVAVEEPLRTTLGIVYQIHTGSLDPSRQPYPYQKTHEELKAEQPQIFEFLKTTNSCVTVGYLDKGRLVHTLAPEPPKIHSFVSQAAIEISSRFFHNTAYLHLLFSASSTVGSLDELLLAILHNAKVTVSTDYYKEFMHTYALLIGNDYRRTKLFLQRAQFLIEQ